MFFLLNAVKRNTFLSPLKLLFLKLLLLLFSHMTNLTHSFPMHDLMPRSLSLSPGRRTIEGICHENMDRNNSIRKRPEQNERESQKKKKNKRGRRQKQIRGTGKDNLRLRGGDDGCWWKTDARFAPWHFCSSYMLLRMVSRTRSPFLVENYRVADSSCIHAVIH